MKSLIHDFSFLDQTKSKSINWLILLNTPFSNSYFNLLSRHSKKLVCADGGANRLYQQIQKHQDSQMFLPYKIIGDLDSLKEETAQFYKAKGIQIIKDQDQNSTDFQKALNLCLENEDEKHEQEYKNGQRQRIVLLGGIGRIDHTLSSISNIFKYSRKYQNIDFILTSQDGLMMPLMPSSTNASEMKREGIFHSIMPSEKYELMDGCGLIPLSKKCQYIETEGLKWNLQDQLTQLQFGAFISTSNCVVSKPIRVWNSQQILWTTSLKFNEQNNFNL